MRDNYFKRTIEYGISPAFDELYALASNMDTDIYNDGIYPYIRPFYEHLKILENELLETDNKQHENQNNINKEISKNPL